MKIKFITDSASDLPKRFAEEHDVTVLPNGVNFGVESYYDGVDITTAQFYEKLKTCTELPKTSQVHSSWFVNALTPYKGTDTLAVIITLSTGMSNTYNVAAEVIKDLGMENNTLLIDSRMVTFEQGAFVMESVKLAEKQQFNGKDELAEQLESLKKRVVLYAVIGDIKYLRYGGRLSASAARIATMLRIKPLISIWDKVDIASKQIGMAKSERFMIDRLKEEFDPAYPVYFGGSDCMNDILEFRQKCIREVPGIDASDYISELGPTVGVHGGPGCYGLAFVAKKSRQS